MLNLKELKENCDCICRKVDRNPSELKILAVSKLQSNESIRLLYQQGQREFGENYVQEALSKQSELKDLSIHWHFIGRLQRNKVRQICGAFSLIHSVSSEEALVKVDQVAAEKNITQSVLLQVNLAHELSKDGFEKEILIQRWKNLCSLPHIQILGFMTMPPLTETPNEVRPYFRELRKLRDELKSQTDLQHHPLSELSMGTSHDYHIAIEEGATYIRIGTVLFGERRTS